MREYLTSSRMTRFNYRLVRNPFYPFRLCPLFLFMVLERRFPSKCKPREHRSVHIMNFALLIWCVSMSSIFGVIPFIIIQVTMMAVAGTCGIWLFYVQHQFEDTYWHREKTGTSLLQAMEGSSFYKLPRIMQWF